MYCCCCRCSYYSRTAGALLCCAACADSENDVKVFLFGAVLCGWFGWLCCCCVAAAPFPRLSRLVLYLRRTRPTQSQSQHRSLLCLDCQSPYIQNIPTTIISTSIALCCLPLPVATLPSNHTVSPASLQLLFRLRAPLCAPTQSTSIAAPLSIDTLEGSAPPHAFSIQHKAVVLKPARPPWTHRQRSELACARES